MSDNSKKMETYKITESMRFRALLYYFGWQGGTITQISRETGLTDVTILNSPLSQDLSEGGFAAVRTCDVIFRRENLAPRRTGNWKFYSGVIRGFWATGPLDGLNDRWPEHPTKTGLMRCIDDGEG